MNDNPSTIDTLSKNLVELRKRLIFALLGIILITLGLLPFCRDIYQIIANPLMTYLPQGSQLIAIDVIAPFFVPVKFTLAVAFFLSMPNTIYQIWQFIAPGLYKKEKLLIFGTMISSFMLFALGVIFCYLTVLPMLFKFITGFKMADIAMMTDIDNYLSFILKLFLIFGIAFETPVVIFILVKLNVLTIKQLTKARKYFFVGSFVIAAIVTPPDVISQITFALSLYALYEFGIIFSRFIPQRD